MGSFRNASNQEILKRRYPARRISWPASLIRVQRGIRGKPQSRRRVVLCLEIRVQQRCLQEGVSDAPDDL